MLHLLSWLHTGTLALLAAFGFKMLVELALAVWASRRAAAPPPPAPTEGWPAVLIQLPTFNERYVVGRLIDAACALDYPADRLTIQVLDDSTDDTTAVARARVAHHRARGCDIMLLHRPARKGYKAGALADGLRQNTAEFVAIFDADFVPPADFIRRLLPELAADPRLGMLQARWEHLNVTANPLTQALALPLDVHFEVEQFARSRHGLLMNFNGTAGLWRRACIDDAGGWQSDTLSEDLDLSYRAQLRGWRLGYRPDVAAPADLPETLAAIKRQQYRWAKGSMQVFRKIAGRLISSRQSLPRKILAVFHLGGYLPFPLILLSLLLSIPAMLTGTAHAQLPEFASWASLGPVLATVWSQYRLRRNWVRRLIRYPHLLLIGIGLSLSQTAAILSGLTTNSGQFERTPKRAPRQPIGDYAIRADWTTAAEAALALYSLIATLLAIHLAPWLTVYLALNTAAFAYVAASGLAALRKTDKTAAKRRKTHRTTI